MKRTIVRAILFAAGLGCLLVVAGGARSVWAQSVGWCSADNGGYVRRVASFPTGVIIAWGEDSLPGFDGGRNSAQQCWEAAIGWLSHPDHPQSVGDTPAEMCASYPYAYAVDSQFYYGVRFNGERLGFPIGTHYC